MKKIKNNVMPSSVAKKKINSQIKLLSQLLKVKTTYGYQLCYLGIKQIINYDSLVMLVADNHCKSLCNFIKQTTFQMNCNTTEKFVSILKKK